MVNVRSDSFFTAQRISGIALTIKLAVPSSAQDGADAPNFKLA
jgi:hypothetical protein